jgi:diaminohydroxyphosphoribosylaminopyrimidine deaminase/5-amino-6-(5-phosphoribosylamino)uracil reductase
MGKPEQHNPLRTDSWDSRERRYMQKALELARRAAGQASPNPTVGCLIVREGRIVGRGWHEYAHRDHAEVRALKEAGSLARGATAYTTLEPCSHYGRTPPCAPLLVQAGIRRVVAARIDPNPLVSGRGMAQLSAAGVRAEHGLMEREAGKLIEPFACRVTTGRPLVVAKAAMSLDGRIATAAGLDRKLTGGEADSFVQELRLQMDAILVGIGTILADDPELTYRGELSRRRPLCRVILDTRLRTPPTARVLRNAPAVPALVFCGPHPARARRAVLEERGAEVICVPRGVHGLNLHRVMKELGRRDLLGVLVEGGSEVHWSFASRRLVDKFVFLLAPTVLGGRGSVPCVGGVGYRRISAAPKFEITRTLLLGKDLLLEAYPSYSRSILSPWPGGSTPPSAGLCSRRS